MPKPVRSSLLLATVLLMGGIGYQFAQPEPARASQCFTYCGGVSCKPTGLQRECHWDAAGCYNTACQI